jgi:hypothetical protein
MAIGGRRSMVWPTFCIGIFRQNDTRKQIDTILGRGTRDSHRSYVLIFDDSFNSFCEVGLAVVVGFGVRAT